MNWFGNLFGEKLSQYNEVVPYQGEYLLYSQVTNALILLTEQEYQEYQKVVAGNFRVRWGFLKMLRYGGYLISRKLDEQKWMHDLAVKKRAGTEYKSLTIATTDRCNLNCVYCYEKKDQWVDMSPATQEALAKFSETMLTSTPTKLVELCWYGGEPTLNIGCVRNLGPRIIEWGKQAGAVVRQTMVTNGTNMTEEVLATLELVGCKKLQITVDGCQPHHDQKRPYLSKIGSSYDAIMTNLPMLRDRGFKISLRSNLDKSNQAHYDDFVKSIEAKGWTVLSEAGGVITPYAARIYGTDERREIRAEDFAKIHFQRTPLRPFQPYNCMVEMRYAFGVSQNGILTKCWQHLTDEQHSVGSVYDLAIAKDGHLAPDVFDDQECVKCKVFPKCLGGCRSMNHDWDTPKKCNGCHAARWALKEAIVKLYESERTKT